MLITTAELAEALRYGTCSQGISQFYLHHIHTFIRNRNESYLPLPSQPQLVLIYRPRRDGRLSRHWCEVAQAEIRTRNLPIANPTLYHTATSAPDDFLLVTPKIVQAYFRLFPRSMGIRLKTHFLPVISNNLTEFVTKMIILRRSGQV